METTQLRCLLIPSWNELVKFSELSTFCTSAMSVYKFSMFLKCIEKQKYLFRHAEKCQAPALFTLCIYPLNQRKRKTCIHWKIEKHRFFEFLQKCINLKVKFKTLSLDPLKLRCTLNMEACGFISLHWKNKANVIHFSALKFESRTI